MALKKCEECGKQVSTKATNCPGCGAAIKGDQKQVGTRTGCLIISGFTFFLILLFVYGSSSKPNAQNAMPANNDKMDQFLEIVAACDRDEVIANLESNSNSSPWRLTITVNQKWGSMPHSTRLEYAKTFKGAWAGIFAPDPCFIDILDKTGNRIGGGGPSQTSIWVN